MIDKKQPSVLQRKSLLCFFQQQRKEKEKSKACAFDQSETSENQRESV